MLKIQNMSKKLFLCAFILMLINVIFLIQKLQKHEVSSGLAPYPLLTEIQHGYGQINYAGPVDKIWPLHNTVDDRIIEQLNISRNYIKRWKIILLFQGEGIGSEDPNKEITSNECRIKECYVTTDATSYFYRADAVFFKEHIPDRLNIAMKQYLNYQVWILSNLELTQSKTADDKYENLVNWTVSHRHDSTIVATPSKYVNNNLMSSLKVKLNHTSNSIDDPIFRHNTAQKTGKVFWMPSQCNDNNGRTNYVNTLKQYIRVDIYGKCGNLKCSPEECQIITRKYKFVLAFERTNCVEHISDTLQTALMNDVLPIVMGARPQDYAAVAPPMSYIHVDDFDSPKHLAEYLHKLDQNDDLYNDYFKWKGTGEFINTKFWCRLCAMLHAADDFKMWYTDLSEWWAGADVCMKPKNASTWASWRDAWKL